LTHAHRDAKTAAIDAGRKARNEEGGEKRERCEIH